MERSKISILVLLAILALLLVVLFYLTRSSFFTRFLFVSIIAGPGMAISYGLENPAFKPLAHLALLWAVNLISIIVIYALLDIIPLKRRFENKLLSKVMGHVHGSREGMEKILDRVSGIFESRFGDIGFYMALAFISFAYGPYIAAIVAFFISVNLRRAIISIAVGSTTALIFWWYMALGMIPFVTPTLVFVVVTGISIVFMIYGFARENRIVNMLASIVVTKRKQVKKKQEYITSKIAEEVLETLDTIKNGYK
jgi:uncharacterized membrane protein